MLGLLQAPLDRRFALRQPGPLARRLIALAAPLVRHMAPNDKWSLGVHAAYWMRAVAEPKLLPCPPPKRLLLFAAYRNQFTLDVSLAALLAWRGHHVVLGYLPRLGSPIKPPLDDHHEAQRYLAAAFRRMERASGGRVQAVDLTAFEAEGADPEAWFVERQSLADSVMRLRLESVDPSLPDHAEALRHYRKRGVAAYRAASGYLARHRGDLDVVLVPNGMSFEPAYVAEAATRAGLALVTFEKFAFRYTRVVTHGGPIFTFHDLGRIWERRAELGLESGELRSAAVAKGREILDERRRSSTRHWAWKYQAAPDQSDEEALRGAGLDPSQPFLLVCTNVPYDAGYYQFTRLFGSMREWLVESVRFLLRETETTVVVRVHPGEALHYKGNESSVTNLVQAGLAGHPRLHTIGPEVAVNTYPLMAACRAGVVFSSTTGIEMAMLGRPVVVGADVYYARRGFTRDCATREDYFGALRSAAAQDAPDEERQRTAEAAALFYYVLHFIQQHPYGYDKGGDLNRCPPHRLVGTEAVKPMLPFLDTITQTPDEFERELVRLYGTSDGRLAGLR
jgi:hypothetical protein